MQQKVFKHHSSWPPSLPKIAVEWVTLFVVTDGEFSNNKMLEVLSPGSPLGPALRGHTDRGVGKVCGPGLGSRAAWVTCSHSKYWPSPPPPSPPARLSAGGAAWTAEFEENPQVVLTCGPRNCQKSGSETKAETGQDRKDWGAG